MEEEEADDQRQPGQAHAPPVCIGPRAGRDDEGTQGRAGHGAEVEAVVEDGKGAATLVQEEEIDQDAGAEDARDRAKEARHEP